MEFRFSLLASTSGFPQAFNPALDTLVLDALPGSGLPLSLQTGLRVTVDPDTGFVTFSASGFSITLTGITPADLQVGRSAGPGINVELPSLAATPSSTTSVLRFGDNNSATDAGAETGLTLTSANGTGVSSGNDIVVGTALNDFIAANNGNDIVQGLAGDDTLIGQAGDDALYGDGGNDFIVGSAGSDELFGGDGDDVIDESYDQGLITSTGISSPAGNNFIFGGAGNDQLIGGAGQDQVHGGTGNDTVSGGAGNDFLTGGSGDDVIRPGIGNDTVTLGAGADTLVLNMDSSEGQNTVTDFVQGTDQIRLVNNAGTPLSSAQIEALFATATQNGNTLTFENGTSLVFQNGVEVDLNDFEGFTGAPTLTVDPEATVTQGSPTDLFAGANVADAEGDWNGGSLTVRIADGGNLNDAFALDLGSNQVSTLANILLVDADGDTVGTPNDDVAIGTYTISNPGANASVTVNFNAAATDELVTRALQAIQLKAANTDERDVTVELVDGDGNSSGVQSLAVTTTVGSAITIGNLDGDNRVIEIGDDPLAVDTGTAANIDFATEIGLGNLTGSTLTVAIAADEVQPFDSISLPTANGPGDSAFVVGGFVLAELGGTAYNLGTVTGNGQPGSPFVITFDATNLGSVPGGEAGIDTLIQTVINNIGFDAVSNAGARTVSFELAGAGLSGTAEATVSVASIIFQLTLDDDVPADFAVVAGGVNVYQAAAGTLDDGDEFVGSTGANDRLTATLDGNVVDPAIDNIEIFELTSSANGGGLDFKDVDNTDANDMSVTLAGTHDTKLLSISDGFASVDASALTSGDLTLSTEALTGGTLAVALGGKNASLESSGGTLAVNATAMSGASTLTLQNGTSNYTVTGLTGDVTSTAAMSGILAVTTADAADNNILVTTGTNNATVTGGAKGDTIIVNAAQMAASSILTLNGLSAVFATGLVANVNAAGLAETLVVSTADAADDAITVVTGKANTTVNGAGGTDTITVDATLLADGGTLTAGGATPFVVTGLTGSLAAAGVSGTLAVTTADAVDNAVAVQLGTNVASVTGSAASDTVTVNATSLANDTLLTVSGASAFTVNALTGDLAATALTGKLDVTTGDNGSDDDIAIALGSAASSITGTGTNDTITVDATALTNDTALTLDGVSAIVVNNLSGDIAGAALENNLTANVTATSVSMTSGNGLDTFNFGATLAAGDQVDGNRSHDVLNASLGSTIAATTAIADVEAINLAVGDGATALDANQVTGANGTIILDDGISVAAKTVTVSNLRVDINATSFDSNNEVLNVQSTASTTGVMQTGGVGNDTLTGGSGADVLVGGAGNDTLTGGGGSDVFRFTALADMGTSFVAADQITDFSRTQADVIDLGFLAQADFDGAVQFVGTSSFSAFGAGQYQVRVSSSGIEIGNNGVLERVIGMTYTGGLVPADFTVNDFIGLDGSAQRLTLTNGIDSFDNNNAVDGALGGSTGNDTFVVNAATDLNAAEDDINAQTGTDTILINDQSGFSLTLTSDYTGIDSIRLAQSAATASLTLENGFIAASDSGVTILNGSRAVDLDVSGGGGTVQIGGSGIVTLSGTANVQAQDGVDTYIVADNVNSVITGGTGNDTLIGGTGDDTLSGGSGNNVIDGGAGFDIMTGGAGIDTFVFDAGDSVLAAIDLINAFTDTADKIDLSVFDLDNDTVLFAKGDIGSNNAFDALAPELSFFNDAGTFRSIATETNGAGTDTRVFVDINGDSHLDANDLVFQLENSSIQINDFIFA